MVVVLTAIEFVNRLPPLEVMLDDEIRRLKLCEHAIHGRKPDILTRIEQRFVNVFSRHVPGAAFFQHFQNLEPGKRNFEASFLDVLGCHRASAAPLERNLFGTAMYKTKTLLYHRAHPARASCQMKFKFCLVLICLLAMQGCNLVYKVNVQQGNILDQDLVDDLKPGMTKRQVELVLGTPAVSSPFRQDRWDYISTFSRRGNEPTVKNLSLVFENNRLVRMEGDYLDEEEPLADESKTAEESAGSR